MIETSAASFDAITDFAVGIERIDLANLHLANIDANTPFAGDQAFSFIGAALFSGGSRQLHADTTTVAGVARLLGDVKGDGVADLEIRRTGTLALGATDFIL